MKKVLVTLLILAVIAPVFAGAYYTVRYPLKYQTEAASACEEYGLDRALVNSVINAESRFDRRAESSAGALGLMQLMPETAAWLAPSAGLADFESVDLFDPAVNINLGCFYLKYLLGRFKDTDTALAAYNAGEGNVAVWLKDESMSDGGKIKPEAIPFKETRDYVRRINKYRKVYSWRSKR